ncbi:glycosyltransferase family 2 protein [Methylophilus methylotrophus]|uniref:glycosyltransferase family 2 protein n=1 Tax=Methylophilus methylotrophus TaxID=17 RepID=UPI00037C7797|nr:glycosyltransferase family 2 protein [Methylophilus methylotrophus]
MNHIHAKNVLPLISVGIPTFNRPESLRRVLLEINQQTYKNLEIIVSDNASTGSETENIVRKVMQNDSRVRYIKQPKNIGPVHNFQFVLMQATGEYFMWAADDDWHDQKFVEVLYQNLMTDTSAVVSFCNFDSRDEHGNPILVYPNFYNTLKGMCYCSNFIRQVQFFLLREGSAKPHPIYGLIRRQNLLGFSWTTFVEKYGWYASDVLFVFYLMTQGRLVLTEQKLFGCTVGNYKSYDALNNNWNLSKYYKFMREQFRYINGYFKISKGLTKATIIVLSPIKLFEITFLLHVRYCYKKIKKSLI